jgi:prepilin-type N-terminal cleavage/methylation domain-containing protein
LEGEKTENGMEKRSWRRARRNGFTAAETVVTVVVLAILAAYATPKLFGLKEQADATEETLKIKDIEARHTQEMLKAGKRGSNPTLGDVVGFRPEVVAEPAPETAPMLVDYSFRIRLYYSTNSFYKDLGYTANSGTIRTSDTTRWGDPDGDGSSSCEEIVTGIQLGTISPKRFGTNGSSATIGLGVKGESLLDAVRVTALGASQDVGVTDTIPSCRVDSSKFYKWGNSNIETPLIPSVWGEPYLGYVPSTLPWVSDSPLHESLFSLTPANVYVRNVAPNSYRYDCSSYSNRYGAPYLTRGLPSSPTGLNGRETTPFVTLVSSLTLIASGAQVTQYFGGPYSPATGNVYDLIPTSSPFSSPSSYCERVGPAPSVPPSDPGDPGAYPMAADGSGYCLSSGRKLPTYRDSSGTPTSSSADPVVELATEAVDDPTNCPG